MRDLILRLLEAKDDGRPYRAPLIDKSKQPTTRKKRDPATIVKGDSYKYTGPNMHPELYAPQKGAKPKTAVPGKKTYISRRKTDPSVLGVPDKEEWPDIDRSDNDDVKALNQERYILAAKKRAQTMKVNKE